MEGEKETETLLRLQKLWWLWVLIIVGASTFAAILWMIFAPGIHKLGNFSLSPLLLPAAILLFELWFLRTRLPLNRPTGGGPLFRTLGAANILTLSRGILIAWFSIFMLYVPDDLWIRWIAVGFFTCAVIADFLDGFLARRIGWASELGIKLEGELDSLAIFVASVVLVAWNRLHPWYLAVGCASYLFRIGVWLRSRLDLPLRPLEHSSSGRGAAGFIMGYLSVALWPNLADRFVRSGGLIFACLLFGSFIRDWLAVTKMIDTSSKQYKKTGDITRFVSFELVPIPLRIIVPVLAFYSLEVVPVGVRIAGVICAFFSTLGIAGRWFSLSFVAILILSVSDGAVGWFQVAALWVSLILVILGTGRYSLWAPERRIFARD